MDTKTYEPLLRNAVIRALDDISTKVARKNSTGPIAQMLKMWEEMEHDHKEDVAGIIIATATTAVTAVAAAATARSRRTASTKSRKTSRSRASA